MLVFSFLSFKEIKKQADDKPVINKSIYDQEAEPEYSVKLIFEDQKAISSHIMGFNLVYVHERDDIWKPDGKVIGYMQDINTSVFRYPGGTVCTYTHWNDLTGQTPWKDTWGDSPIVRKPEKDFMDIDEFIEVCRATNAMPLVGINMSSGWRWNRLEDGINEALALMQHLKDKNFDVTYYYLDNEPYMDDANGGAKTIPQYASLVNLFADAMREFDPNIKIIINWKQAFQSSGRRNEYRQLFELAGRNIDVVDIHWYWNYTSSNMNEWLAKTPLQIWSGHTYLSEITYFRQMVADFGYPDTELASLEWNASSNPGSGPKLTAPQYALIQSELMMNFIAGGLDIATFWPFQWTSADLTLRSFLNRSTLNPQPNYNTFKFLGKFQGNQLIKTQVTQSQPHIFMVAAIDDDEEIIRIAFLNKNAGTIKANINSDVFEDMVLEEAKVYVLTGGGSGSAVNSFNLLEHTASGIAFNAPSISLSMLTFKYGDLSDINSINSIDHETIYPNPANDFINLKLPVNEKETVVKLLNSSGSQLFSEIIPSWQDIYTIDLNNIQKGIYFVIIEMEKTKSVKKLVIL